MRPSSETGKRCIEYLKANPGLPTKQIARMLYRDYPLLFHHVEHARGQLRFYRGARGAVNLHSVKSGATKGKLLRPRQLPHNPWKGLPPALQEFQWRIIDIPEPLTAVLADLHMPYYDSSALLPTLDHIIDRKPQCVVVLGDLLDFYELSKFDKNPAIDKLQLTLRCGFELFKALRTELPKARIIWKYGNHDDRWEKFCWSKSPEFCRMMPKFKDLEWIMNHPSLYADDLADNATDGLDIEIVKDPVPLRIAKLYLLHGHELRRGATSPVNAARGAFLKTLCCVMTAHEHQESKHTQMTLEGRQISTWSLPCLMNLHPRYSPHNPTWSHGFAYVNRIDQDNFSVEMKAIIRAKVDGKPPEMKPKRTSRKEREEILRHLRCMERARHREREDREALRLARRERLGQ
jgi:predicted phosphodiesterase